MLKVPEVPRTTVLLARPLLAGGEQELVPLQEEVKRALGRVPIVGAVPDGQRSIRNAVAHALPQHRDHRTWRGVEAQAVALFQKLTPLLPPQHPPIPPYACLGEQELRAVFRILKQD
ncbi:hypothetical protein [Corallococcus aberystwythensis]|uniref:hypothetical protein n=1 Tax=Corallococcus aberystwythensis TaxID=2316722 RepID=UPI001FCA3FB6|nr:hypothetical protein [Corallococcus aberystwythensis]